MTHHLEIAPSDACVWMSAGVLNYKLCDRHFDCEHCPLDAALHGAPPTIARETRSDRAAVRSASVCFPGDRLYSPGHTWLRPLPGRPERLRFGLDGFAASLVACPRGIRWNAAPRFLQRGEPICAIELDDGLLDLSAPVPAQLCGRNRALDDDPGTVTFDPYGEGWLAELSRAEETELGPLLSEAAAQKQARLDLRRLRRCIALHLLTEDGDEPLLHQPSGEIPSAPWRILDGAGYLHIVREVVH